MFYTQYYYPFHHCYELSLAVLFCVLIVLFYTHFNVIIIYAYHFLLHFNHQSKEARSCTAFCCSSFFANFIMSSPIESCIVFVYFECQRQDKSTHPYVQDSKQCGPKRKPQNWIDIHRIRNNKPKPRGKKTYRMCLHLFSPQTVSFCTTHRRGGSNLCRTLERSPWCPGQCRVRASHILFPFLRCNQPTMATRTQWVAGRNVMEFYCIHQARFGRFSRYGEHSCNDGFDVGHEYHASQRSLVVLFAIMRWEEFV